MNALIDGLLRWLPWYGRWRPRDVIDTPERIAGLEKRLEDRALSIADRKVQFQYRNLFRQKLKDMVNARRRRISARPCAASTMAVSVSASCGNPGGSPQNARFSGPRTGQEVSGGGLNGPAGLRDQPSRSVGNFRRRSAMINVSDPLLDKLRQEILKVHALAEELDSTGLKNQLSNQGNGEILQSVLSSEATFAGFARVDAPDEEVRTAGRLGFVAAAGRRGERTWKRRGSII